MALARHGLRAGAAFACAAILLGPLQVKGDTATHTDLALLLAMDTSYSVDGSDYRIQLEGLADALRSEEIVKAATAGPNGNIVIAVMQWSDMDQQDIVIPWTRIADLPGAALLAERVRALPRSSTGATSISGAIFSAQQQFDDLPINADRKVLDISSDGVNNEGARPEDARDQAAAAGVVINGLTILKEVPFLDAYFRQRVITGRASFVEKTNDYRAYREAIKRKLLREILPPSV